MGVEPTVGLGSALIIFLLVGVFAAGIAQAFQLVSLKKSEKLFDPQKFRYQFNHANLTI